MSRLFCNEPFAFDSKIYYNFPSKMMEKAFVIMIVFFLLKEFEQKNRFAGLSNDEDGDDKCP